MHALVCLAGAASLTGCLVDTDKRCSANEKLVDKDFAGCVCVDNAVLNAKKDGCDLCGANTVVKDGACVCATGYAKLAADGECVMSALESPCSASSGCTGDYPFCAPGGYCSKSGCRTAADCPATYACETNQSPPYCSRPPVGQGAVCDVAKNSADCTAEADYCVMGHCVVSGCATTKTCHGDWVCCDFSRFGLRDICTTPGSLIDGMCPGTGAAPVVR
ncbi:MAG: hypothetical protein JWN04_3904 [Myxococcaceae bacterium]|nr:hypothetical protein [Myxococcaceae bacterium]